METRIERCRWELVWTGIDELSESEAEHIGEMIKLGHTNGEIIQEVEDED